MKHLYSVGYESFFNCSPSKLIEVIKEPGNLNNFHPFCKKNTAVSWPGDDASDELTYLNDKTFIRKINRWHENGYDLTITSNRVTADVHWNVFPKNSGASLEIKIYPGFLNKGKLLNFLFFYLYIKPKLRSYLKSIFKGLDFYLSTDSRVRPNQFGRHTWFS